MREGTLGRERPSARDHADMAKGLALLNASSPFDVGQAVVVADARVLAIEAAGGTGCMLARIADLRQSGRIAVASGRGVLVKAAKRDQDPRLGLPSVGPPTVGRAGAGRPARVPGRLPRILGLMRFTAKAVVTRHPHVLVIIDSPGFTRGIARRVRAADPTIPIVEYVSPSVWAWRPGRARVMRAYIDHILALLPFEPAVHQRLGGPPCTYVGHPLIEEVGNLRPNAEETRRRLADPPVLLMLPGSRSGELDRLLAIFAEAVALVREHVGSLELIVATVPHLAGAIREASAQWPLCPRIVVEKADKQAAFRIATAALAKSGTVTLELALAGVPMIAAYKVSSIEYIAVGRGIRSEERRVGKECR